MIVIIIPTFDFTRVKVKKKRLWNKKKWNFPRVHNFLRVIFNS
jgi:hypothetical protein